MNGLCNLNNVVYQRIIYPKENINDRKTYIGISSMFRRKNTDNDIPFPEKLINKRSELIARCRHRDKFKL